MWGKNALQTVIKYPGPVPYPLQQKVINEFWQVVANIEAERPGWEVTDQKLPREEETKASTVRILLEKEALDRDKDND